MFNYQLAVKSVICHDMQFAQEPVTNSCYSYFNCGALSETVWITKNSDYQGINYCT